MRIHSRVIFLTLFFGCKMIYFLYNRYYMKNYLVSKTFYAIADMLDIKGEEFKPQAYRKVARIIETMTEDVEELCKNGELDKIHGVGVHLKQKIEELITTGKLKYYNELRKEIPMDFEDLMSIEGIGPKMVKILYEELNIKTIKELEKAAAAGKIRNLFHLGEKTEQKILVGIKFFKRNSGRFLLGLILPMAREIVDILKGLAEKIEIVGSIRRKKETVGDIDILAVATESQKIIDTFVSMSEVEVVHNKGAVKSSVRLRNGIDVDLRVVKKDCFGAALQYFTGNKEHNIELRKIALSKNLKLNEYGVFKKTGNKSFIKIAGQSEKEIYKTLGLSYIEPELREMKGEIEAAKSGKLPNLIGYGDLLGDLHTHTNWSEGSATIQEMAERALSNGLNYIAITDHAGRLKVANAMDEIRLLRQIKEIDKINKELKSRTDGKLRTKILKGAEVDINKSGTLDIRDEVLAKLDIVAASIHSDLKMPRIQMTQRILSAMANPYMKILAHPTGRIIRRREPYELDWGLIFQVAKDKHIALEVNAFPERLDLRDEDIREAIRHNVKMTISSDAHSPNHLSLIEFGIAAARRGWAEKKDILNTLPLDKLLKWFKEK